MKAKVTVSVDEGLLRELDRLVENDRFDSRSAAMEAAIVALQGNLLEAEFERNLALLDPAEERAAAELGMGDYATLLGRMDA
jgi:Arc/MetJ-type ribon-helix-helix transcriptional regulator